MSEKRAPWFFMLAYAAGFIARGGIDFAHLIALIGLFYAWANLPPHVFTREELGLEATK